jgi:hypothetical protein
MPGAPALVADYDRGFFCVEGPMADDPRRRTLPSMPATMSGRSNAAQLARIATRSPPTTTTHKLAGVPPGSILRVRQ